MTIVSDASPLYGLLFLGRAELLEKLYGQILIPGRVHREVVILASQWMSVAQAEAALSFIKVMYMGEHPELERMLAKVDLGEAEAIVLAKTISADYLIIDEAKGRKAALGEGLTIKGLIRVLVDAKDAGMIDAVKPLINTLMDKISFRVSPSLYADALRTAGEL